MRYLIVVLIFLTACTKEPETSPVVQDIKELVFASGEIEWQNPYDLVAQTEGVLSEFSIEIGDELLANQKVGWIDNASNRENLKSAEELLQLSRRNAEPVQQQIRENIAFAEQKLMQDKLQAERYARLYEKQSVSKNEYENMIIAEENSLAQLNALKQQLRAAEVQSQQAVASAKGQRNTSSIATSYNQVKISEGSTVIEKLKYKGDYVKKGDVLARLANSKQTEIVLNVDENNIAKIKVGQKVFIRLNTDKEKTYDAVVTAILSAFDQEAQSFICKAKIIDEGVISLYGTPLEANILIGEKKNALLVPRNLVGYGNSVRVKGKEESVQIKTGIISTDYVEVLAGISKDDILLPLQP
jgi:multidrug efflux pump subunit AcrA (membrane-fusion protein)